MTCDVAQNRLLALPGPAGVPADLRAHLDGCELCRRYRDRAAVLAAELAALPSPPAEAARAAFLDALTAAGPVIKSIPTLPARTGSGSWRAVARRVPWRPAAGLAAAALVGVGLWSAARPPKGPDRPDPAAGERYELLAKVVELDTRLATADTPGKRLPVLTDMAVALKDEANGVYMAARTPDEVRSLADLFEKVVQQGIVKQAGKFDRFAVAERHAALTAAADALAAAGADVAARVPSAPPGVKDDLARMAKAAADARAALLKLDRGEGA